MKELSPEAKAKRAAYYREWRKKNPDKTKKYAANYWEKKATATQTENQ